MTRKKAETLAARLTRIWVQEGGSNRLIFTNFSGSWWCFKFTGEIKNDVFVHVELSNNTSSTVVYRGNCEVHWNATFTQLQYSHRPPSPDNGQELARQLADEVTPIMRRCCWLSGSPTEASMTEKMEWIQGFTRAEIETWNLKF